MADCEALASLDIIILSPFRTRGRLNRFNTYLLDPRATVCFVIPRPRGDVYRGEADERQNIKPENDI